MIRSLNLKFFLHKDAKTFSLYKKISKDLSARYYKKKKKEGLMKSVKIFSKKEKRKSGNMDISNIKISEKNEKQRLVELRKK